MSRLSFNRVILSALACCVTLLVGCGADTDATAASAEMTSFENGAVSLELPDSFVGGNPRDPAVMAELELRAASDLGQASGLGAGAYLNIAKETIGLASESGLEDVAPILFMLGPTSTWGSIPVVAVGRTGPETFLPEDALDVISMRALVDAAMANTPEPVSRSESLSDDRAYIVSQYEAGGEYKNAFQVHTVLLLLDGYLYNFTFCGEVDGALEAVFRSSANTATVTGGSK